MTVAAGTPPSRRRWLIIALTVSVAINLFIAGLVVGHFHRLHRPPAGMHNRFEHIVGNLGLTETQNAAFREFQTALRVHGAAMRTANAAAWAKIADPATKPDQIPALLAQTVKNRTEFQQDIATAMGKFLASLKPEQRATFIEQARRPWYRRH